MAVIDLRSDTVTRPSPEMRNAMAHAEVGDDVYAEDPTVNKLQALAAEILGFEAGLFVPSGTMGNQVAIWTHTTSGEEVILEEESHIFNYELGTASAFSGVTPRPVSTADGALTVQNVKDKLTPDKYYLPETGLIALENTHNNKGGRVYPYKELRKMVEFAKDNDIPIHLDGARLFNAAIASDREPSEIVKGFDSVMFCLSKGLGAPVGSVLVGGEDFLEKALVGRKRFGGGMRQVGILAAAGIYALENNISRLERDHENAKKLGQELKELGFGLTPDPVETNIIFINTDRANINAYKLADYLKKMEIKIEPGDSGNIRFVTHLDVTPKDIEETVSKIKQYITR